MLEIGRAVEDFAHLGFGREGQMHRVVEAEPVDDEAVQQPAGTAPCLEHERVEAALAGGPRGARARRRRRR